MSRETSEAGVGAAGAGDVEAGVAADVAADVAAVAAAPGVAGRLVDGCRVGVVSFLNTAPLMDGLGHLAGVAWRQAVPSGLIDLLLAGEVDMALCSSIDYQRSPQPLAIVPCGILGCDGPTLTVRLYSSIPLHRVTRVWCDTDSHTSVVLMRLLMRGLYQIDPVIEPYDAREHVAGNRVVEWPEAMLLIGDKVVTDSPAAVRYPHQLDLGAAWANWTGQPFVFACWMMRKATAVERIRAAAMALDRARRANAMRVDSIVAERARPRGWPVDLARTYLGEYLAFEWTAARRRGLEMFFDRAFEGGLVERRRPIELVEWR
jgi:chorismate dehydratase